MGQTTYQLVRRISSINSITPIHNVFFCRKSPLEQCFNKKKTRTQGKRRPPAQNFSLISATRNRPIAKEISVVGWHFAVSKPRETPRAAEQPSRFSKGAALFRAQRRSSFFSNPLLPFWCKAQKISMSLLGVQNSDKMGCGNSGMDGWAKKKHPFDGQKRGPRGSWNITKKTMHYFWRKSLKIASKICIKFDPSSIDWLE